jgi:predicted Ser/Thr protein kinase
MSAAHPGGTSSVSSSIIDWIYEVHKRFEAVWKTAGPLHEPPRIEEYLGDSTEPRRSALLVELIPLDLFYRRRRGDTPRAEEYLARFPTLDPAWLTSVLGERSTAEVSSVPSIADLSTGTDLHAAERITDRQPALPADRIAGGLLFGGYELFEKLGQGGMGVVYRARQRSANRIVALKLIRADRLHDLPADRRQQWLTRFQTEAQAAARIEHDHVVAVYEVGEIDGTPFYSMRYVPGQSLADILRAGPVTSAQAAGYLEPVARGVHCAHEQGILHRDLKPANILVDAGGRPYVTDFGLAKCLEAVQEMTRTGDLVGTPPYMSPEQARDSANVTAACDVYSLGATLYALLTGRPPFQAATVRETLEQVRSQEPVPVRRLQPTCPRDLETICLKCLQKEIDRRYSSAEALAEDLRRFQAGEQIHARPVGPGERVTKWVRRRPALAGMAALLVAVSAVALGFILWDWREAVRLRGIADEKTGIAKEKAEGETRALGRVKEELENTERSLGRGNVLLAQTAFEAEWQTASEEGGGGWGSARVTGQLPGCDPSHMGMGLPEPYLSGGPIYPVRTYPRSLKRVLEPRQQTPGQRWGRDGESVGRGQRAGNPHPPRTHLLGQRRELEP